jgi:cell division protein FtsN
MQIIPGLPNPHSDRTYRLQVGSFSGQDAAAKTAQYLRSAGFNVAYERDGYNVRVVLPDVPASMVQSTVQRLGTLGIGEVWIR